MCTGSPNANPKAVVSVVIPHPPEFFDRPRSIVGANNRRGASVIGSDLSIAIHTFLEWRTRTKPRAPSRIQKLSTFSFPDIALFSLFSTMAHLAPSVLRQASRLASKSSISAVPRRGVQALSRAATVSTRSACKRCYVTDTKADHAQVQVDTAIRLDRQDLEKSGVTLSAQDGSTTHVSPMAGKLCFALLCFLLAIPCSQFPARPCLTQVR